MALPRLGAAGNDGLEYFSKVSELIQGDEHRRHRRRQRSGSDTERGEPDLKDYDRGVAHVQQQNSLLPSLHKSDATQSMPSLRRGSAKRESDDYSGGLSHARSSQGFERSSQGFDRGHYFSGPGSNSSHELPPVGSPIPAVGARLKTPSIRGSPDGSPIPATPGNRYAGSMGRTFSSFSTAHLDGNDMMHNPRAGQWGGRMPGMPGDFEGHGLMHSESSDDLLLSQRRGPGQLPARMMGVHNSIDCSGSATTFQRGAVPGLGRVASLPALHGTGSGGLCDTQRQSWNLASSSGAIGSVPSTASTSSASDMHYQQQQAAACPWSAPWQPTPAGLPDSPPVVSRVPAFQVPPIPPVPIRGENAASKAQQAPTAADPWSAPWQPRAATDAVLGPCGELPPVAELSERSSQAYPSSLSGRQDGEISTGSSPLRTPVPGIGPPTPDTFPPLGSVETMLESALNPVPREGPSSPFGTLPNNGCFEGASPPLNAPHVSSPFARPTPNCSPDLSHSRALLQTCIERSKPPPPLCEPGTSTACARDYPNSPLAMHHSPCVDSPVRKVVAVPCSSPFAAAYPPSPVAAAHADLQPIARSHDRKPRSPLERKDCVQKSISMAAVPVLGPLPSLSLRQGPR